MSGEPLRENLVLIGFMGCGKSTVGRILHQILGWPLVDMDGLIEQRAGMGIPAIFAAEGEAGFRRRESELLAELETDGISKRIIATGGGVVINPENRARLRRLGYVIWLRAPAKTVLARTSRSHDRPLLHTEKPLERIQSMLAERMPLYEETAHLEIETSDLSADEIATGILESARYDFGGRM
jgi:shikimate kinase